MKQTVSVALQPKMKAFITILVAGLVSGVLDSTAASVVFYFKLGLNPGQVMQYIASALYGPAAFSGGATMVIIGILLHFTIAFVITSIYFYCYPLIDILGKYPVLSGLSFGLGIWYFLNLVVIPFTEIQPAPVETTAVIIGIVWHMLLVGLPISFIVKRHFVNNPLL